VCIYIPTKAQGYPGIQLAKHGFRDNLVVLVCLCKLCLLIMLKIKVKPLTMRMPYAYCINIIIDDQI